MQSEPGRNSGEVALFDLDGSQAEGARCEGPGCENTLPPRTGRGRRPVYCSQACKSRADRARVKARAAAVLSGPVAPDSAEAASGERTGGKRPASGLSVERQRVLGAADAIRDRAEAFLAAVDDDPLAAHAELARRVHGLASLLITSAREVRDQVRWPGLDADARTAARIREEWNLPDPDPNTDRGDFPVPASPLPGTGEAHRGEKDSGAVPNPLAPKTPRDETGAAADEPALLRSAVADPLSRFGRPDRHHDLSITFGQGWQLATWDSPQAGGARLLVRAGVPIGWTTLLPQGPWGLGGWIAVEHQGPGKPGRVVVGTLGRPQTFATADLALDVFHQSSWHLADAVPPRTPATAVRTPAAPMPNLTLGQTTGRTAPTERALGEARRDYALGDGLVHLTWPTAPHIQALERRGRLLGWTEVYDDNTSWIALINGHPIADAADNLPLLSTNPTDALTLLRLAVERGLAGIAPGWVLPRTAE